MLADNDVGKETLAKSNFLKRYLEVSPSISMMTTGVHLTAKMVEHRGKNIGLQFWIISDEKERFQHIWNMYIRGSLRVILMYDITNAKTLNMVSEWCRMTRDCGKDIPILLVGNKIDLEEQREVSKDEVDKFKEDHDISSSMEISLKTGENIEKMFMKITEMGLKYSESIKPLTPLVRTSERFDVQTASIMTIILVVIFLFVLLSLISYLINIMFF